MLGPEYLASLPEPAVKLWQQAEDDILRDIARRFKKAGAITTTAAWQTWRLEQTRAVYTDTEKKLAEYTGQSREVIRRLLIEAGTEALLADDTIHRQAGKDPPPANQSGQLLNLLNAGYRQTLGTWLNLTATTANTVSGEFEHALSGAWLQVSSGAFDYNTAIRRAVDDLADRMAYVTYPSGHKDTLETAVRRAVLTGMNQTAGKLQMARAEEMGCEFVEVTAHEGARPDHALWQGRIYHIGGEIDYEGNHYEDFVKATGYGTGPGLCGWNCRHNFYPFYPGISLRAYTDERLAELNAPSVEYRGKKYTQYEISQMQRAKERAVRKYKRRFLAESAAGLDTGTSAVRLKAARQDLKQFIRETGSKEDSARISVHGFGRSAAGKATWAAKKAAEPFADFRKKYSVVSAEELLPNYQNAIIPDSKVQDYILNIEHPVGGAKAVAFRDVLGYTKENAGELIAEIMRSLPDWKAMPRQITKYGQPYEVRMLLHGMNGRLATVKTGWIINEGQDVPRLTSAYIYKEKG